MTTQVIPVLDAAQSRFSVRLDGRTYRLRLTWNDRMQAPGTTGTWVLDVADAEGNDLVGGVRVVLDWPLLYGSTDERLPPGELLVLDPSGRQDHDPGRGAWRPLGEVSATDVAGEGLRLVYVPEADL